jgi:ParB family transcriptional regulator, chromosome partitioning protein
MAKKLTPQSARVTKLSVSKIEPNPHNPRRLFDDEPMRILRESIEKLGVLVPITVYPGEHDDFVLLDGERRWRCAKELQLQTIPAIIVDKPDDTRNILTMFHIHNVREGWQLMPTALKLKRLMEELKTTNERELNELTKLSVSQIRRCKILLTYPKKFQNLMLAPPSKRMKTDFFVELDRIRKPARDDKLVPWTDRGDSACIQIMLDKFMAGTIRAVTEFRYLAEVYRASQRLGKGRQFERQLDRFFDDESRRVEDVRVSGASFAKEAKEVKRSAKRLFSQLEDLELADISSDEDVIDLLRELSKLLAHKLEDALLTGARHDSADED